MTEAITREIAEKDVETWLDKKKIFTSTRDGYKDFIDILVDAVMAKVLVLDETGKWVHTLAFPIGGGENEGKLDTMTYYFRLNTKMLRPHLNGVKSGNADGRMDAHIAALTNTSKALIESMDASTDKRIANAIAIFFT